LTTPGTLPLGEALDHSIPLAQLMARVQAAQQRFAALRALLPAELLGAVRPGPLDDVSWVLLTDGSAAAAKLRQSLPRLETALAEAGWPAVALKVKVQPRAKR
jgi:hypothetical protein